MRELNKEAGKPVGLTVSKIAAYLGTSPEYARELVRDGVKRNQLHRIGQTVMLYDLSLRGSKRGATEDLITLYQVNSNPFLKLLSQNEQLQTLFSNVTPRTSLPWVGIYYCAIKKPLPVGSELTEVEMQEALETFETLKTYLKDD